MSLLRAQIVKKKASDYEPIILAWLETKFSASIRHFVINSDFFSNSVVCK